MLSIWIQRDEPLEAPRSTGTVALGGYMLLT